MSARLLPQSRLGLGLGVYVTPARFDDHLSPYRREQQFRELHGIVIPLLVEIMQSGVHPGFSVFQGERIAPDDHQARQRVAGYLVHPPIALDRLRRR